LAPNAKIQYVTSSPTGTFKVSRTRRSSSTSQPVSMSQSAPPAGGDNVKMNVPRAR
jgi:hypothetical protein